MAAQRVMYLGGVIITADSARPRADWMLIDGNHIAAVALGPAPDSLSRSATTVQLGGKVVVPGLVDAHVHMVDAGLALANDWSDVTTGDALQQRLRSAVADRRADRPIVGRNLLEAAFRQWSVPIVVIDSIAPNTPVVLFLRSGHAAVVNDAALRRYHLERAAARDGRGRVTGWLLEDAAMDVSRRIAGESSATDIERAMLAFQEKALSYGITTIGDNTFAPHHYKMLQALAQDGALSIRVRSRSYGRLPITADLMQTLGIPKLGLIGTKPDPARIRYHATKYFVDQSLSLPTSATGTRPGGATFMTPHDVATLLRSDPHATMAFHVQGDSALAGVLGAVEAVEGARGPRHVIDHAGYASRALLARVRRDGLALTAIGPQTFDRASLLAEYRRRSGASIHEDDLLDVVAHVRDGGAAITSDTPYGQDTVIAGHPEVDGFNPWATIAAVTLGVGPDSQPMPIVGEQRLTLDEALAAYTRRGAWTLGDEALVGRIAPGLRADFAVLRTGVTWAASPALYARDVVEQTFIDGRVVYRRDVRATPSRDVRAVSPTDWTVSPVIGYNPAFGTVLGAAFFTVPLTTPGTLSSTQLEASTAGQFAIDASRTRFDAWPQGTLSLALTATNFRQPYFGEGGSTSATARRYVDGLRWRGQLQASQVLSGAWSASVAAEFRSRREWSVRDTNDRVVANAHIAPNETGGALSLGVAHDTRDEPANARAGHLVALQASFLPTPDGAMGATNALLLAADVRQFRIAPVRGAVLAVHGLAAVASGTPSYAWRYSLGGATLLRGAWDNRYRGDRVWAAQGELRVPVSGRLSLAGFVDAGAVGVSRFGAPVVAGGGGIRFALRRTVVLRLDYGATRDQTGVFFTFGQPF